MNFADVLSQNNVQTFTEGKYCRRGWIQFHCPFCFGGLDPHKPYAGYCIAYNYVNCWRCGPHGLGKTLMALTGLEWRVIKPILDNLDTPRQAERETFAGKLVLPKNIEPLQKAHKRYLRGRGYNVAELQRLWRLEGIGLSSELAWRVFIPIHYRGRLVSWTTRSIVDTGTRYISASEDQEAVPHKSLLYGADYATNAISVHEGPADVWRVGPGAVATLGTGFSSAQVLKMSKYPRRIICFDSDPAAQRRARRLCDLLEVFPGETFNVTLSTKDAGVGDAAELDELRELLT